MTTIKITNTLAIVTLLATALTATAQANTAVVSGTIYHQAGGTTFDTYHIDMQTTGTFTVNVLGYEATQSSTITAGYYAADINGDGELTWLDPDTSFYKDDGHLDSTDALVRCDDINNNCPVYQNGLTTLTSPVQVTSLTQADGASDGSIHFRRDPDFSVNMVQGNYLYLIADYTLSPTEAASGINTNDNFSAPTGFVNPILDHAAYRITFSSDTLNFAINGQNIKITAAPVPVPGAIWLFGSALAGLIGRKKLI